MRKRVGVPVFELCDGVFDLASCYAEVAVQSRYLGRFALEGVGCRCVIGFSRRCAENTCDTLTSGGQ